MTEVTLTKGQYDTLMRLTKPNACQTDRIKALRFALEEAQNLRNRRFLVEMTEQMIDAASFVLKTAALKGGAALRLSRRFDHEYIQRPCWERGQTERQRLLEVMQQGAEIREVISYAPAAYRPRFDNDPEPWVVHDVGLHQDFRLPDRDVHPVWGDK
jgi:hypothetical protein